MAVTVPSRGLSARPGLDPASPALWVLVAVGLGGLIGLGTGVGGPSVGILLALSPLAVVVAARPYLLPGFLMVSVFAEAYAIGGVSISRVAGPLALGLLVLQLREHSPVSFRGLDRPLVCAIGLYAAWAVASSLWTVNFDATLTEGGTGFAISSLILSTVYLVAVASMVSTQRHLLWVVVVVWALSSVMGLLAILEQLGGSDRATGVSGDANFFASLQIVAIPIGAVLSSYVRTTSQRAIVLIGIGIGVGSIFVTLSRGGILALIAIILLLSLQPARIYFGTRARKRAFFGVVLVGAAILLTLSYSALSARTSMLFDSQEGGSGRANLWLAARSGIEQHPVLGLGFGAFPSESNELMQSTPGVEFSAYRLRPGGQPVHNAYLESLVELGPLGLGLFLAMLGVTLRAMRRAARTAAEHGNLFVSAIARATGLSLIGFCLTSIFLSTETDRTLWVLMALALTLGRIARTDPAPGRRPA